MKNEIDESIFWNLRRTLTHNALFYIILGNRGGGKSFGAKWYAIDRFIKNGEQFGYIRRYKEDLTNSMKQFFKDIEYKYPDYEFKVDKNNFYIRIKSGKEVKKVGGKKVILLVTDLFYLLPTIKNQSHIPILQLLFLMNFYLKKEIKDI